MHRLFFIIFYGLFSVYAEASPCEKNWSKWLRDPQKKLHAISYTSLASAQSTAENLSKSQRLKPIKTFTVSSLRNEQFIQFKDDKGTEVFLILSLTNVLDGYGVRIKNQWQFNCSGKIL